MHHIVPKVRNVAGQAHHDVPAPVMGSCAPGSGTACPHTGQACPALAAFFPHFGASPGPEADDALSWIRALAPCGQCRVAVETGRDGLRHMRLGQRERDILIAAAAGPSLVLTEVGMSRSLSAARRRAALSLAKAGLVVSASPPAGGAMATQRATVTLTPLGHYVMAAYGRFISAGKPVRWTRPARSAALPGSDPADLRDEVLARTQAALRETLDDLKGVLIAAVGRRLKSPGLLDTVTRHLERKATVLRAVLEPGRTAAAAPVASRSAT